MNVRTKIARMLVGVVVMSTLAVGCATAGPTVVLVRHAEKADDGKDPPLTAAGQKRAAALVRLLERTGVDAIYSSEYIRTQETVAPLSDATGLRTEVVPAREPELLLEKLRQHSPDDVVVVSGHSNTLPAIMGELGAQSVPHIDHHEYDRIFLVTMRASGPPSVVELTFGRRSPKDAVPVLDVEVSSGDDDDGIEPIPAEANNELSTATDDVISGVAPEH